jgi:SNF2 family DNA or RNA helicase
LTNSGLTPLVEDVKAKVLEYLAQLYVDHSPEFIYFKTLFHVFEAFLSGQDEQAQFFDNTAITDTEIWKALFDFQKDGVKGAIQKINTHNGCILADSVGLGKTYSALAIIKYFELRNPARAGAVPQETARELDGLPRQQHDRAQPFRS